MWKAEFWKQALERAVKTIAQFIGLGILGTGLGVLEIDMETWKVIVLAALAAAAVSVLTSIASLGAGPGGSPSLVRVWDAAQLRLAEATRGVVTAVAVGGSVPVVEARVGQAEAALADLGQLKP